MPKIYLRYAKYMPNICEWYATNSRQLPKAKICQRYARSNSKVTVGWIKEKEVIEEKFPNIHIQIVQNENREHPYPVLNTSHPLQAHGGSV